jgi:hypothetical protein
VALESRDQNASGEKSDLRLTAEIRDPQPVTLHEIMIDDEY